MEHFTDTAISPKSFPTGKGIGIAILDTGISPVADFTIPTDRIIAFQDFINGRTTPYDDNGHGTHVTGAKKETTPMLSHRRCLFPFSYNALYVGVRDYPIDYWNMRNATSTMMQASTKWLQAFLHHCIFFSPSFFNLTD